MGVSDMASAVGKGLFAGLAGTAVMTVSSTLEANLSGRGASSTLADALSAALRVRPYGEAGQQRLNIVAHWGYGTSWGAVRGLLGAMGASGPARPRACCTSQRCGRRAGGASRARRRLTDPAVRRDGDRDRRLSPCRVRDRHQRGLRVVRPALRPAGSVEASAPRRGWAEQPKGCSARPVTWRGRAVPRPPRARLHRTAALDGARDRRLRMNPVAAAQHPGRGAAAATVLGAPAQPARDCGGEPG
jgi:hypothetical protein